MDPEIKAIQDEHHERLRLLHRITIVQEPSGQFTVYEYTADSVMPASVHPNARAGAARVLQLLNLKGPIYPQQYAEVAKIGP